MTPSQTTEVHQYNELTYHAKLFSRALGTIKYYF